MRVAVDWDATLVDGEQSWLPGATVALSGLLAGGHSIVIHSCRANWPEGLAQIRRTLDGHGFYAVPVWDSPGKPNADLYIDDRALRFEGDWHDFMPRVFAALTNQ